jgi:hypothetical protein
LQPLEQKEIMAAQKPPTRCETIPNCPLNDGSHQQLIEDVRAIRTCLMGDPEHTERASIVIRLDRIEQAQIHDGKARLESLEESHRTNKWWIRSTAVVVLGLAIRAIWNFVVDGKKP